MSKTKKSIRQGTKRRLPTPESIGDFRLRLSAMMRGRNELDARNSKNRAPEWALRRKGSGRTPSETMAFGKKGGRSLRRSVEGESGVHIFNGGTRDAVWNFEDETRLWKVSMSVKILRDSDGEAVRVNMTSQDRGKKEKTITAFLPFKAGRALVHFLRGSHIGWSTRSDENHE